MLVNAASSGLPAFEPKDGRLVGELTRHRESILRPERAEERREAQAKSSGSRHEWSEQKAKDIEEVLLSMGELLFKSLRTMNTEAFLGLLYPEAKERADALEGWVERARPLVNHSATRIGLVDGPIPLNYAAMLEGQPDLLDALSAAAANLHGKPNPVLASAEERAAYHVEPDWAEWPEIVGTADSPPAVGALRGLRLCE